MKVEHPEWATEGADVFLVDFGNGWGAPTSRAAKIKKVTPTQIVVGVEREHGAIEYRYRARYAHQDPTEIGKESYRSSKLVAADDPRLSEWAAWQERQNVKVAAKRAVDAWQSRTDDYDYAEAAIAALQAFVAAKESD